MVERDSQVSSEGRVPVEMRRSSEIIVDWRNPESLSREWDRQSRDLTRRFAEKKGMSEEEYTATLPNFGPIPESFKNKDIAAVPILVDPRVSWPDLLGSDVDLAKARQARSRQGESQQLELDFEHLRINPMFDLQDLKDWTEGDFQTPDDPYSSWMTYSINKSVNETRSVIKRSQYVRGGTALDVIFLYYRRHQILNDLDIMLPGSQLDSDIVPFLSALPNREGRPNHPSLNKGSIDKKSACLIASRT